MTHILTRKHVRIANGEETRSQRLNATDPHSSLWDLRCMVDIDFMGPFPSSFGNSYILLALDYVTKWVEVKATRSNDAKVVVSFIKTHLRLRMPHAMSRRTHFYNPVVEALFKKYHVTHHISTACHPQTNGQAEVFNREVKSILEKIVNPNIKD